jgi:hypothetical protein
MFGQKKSGFTLNDITKTASTFGITPNFLKKSARTVGMQMATSAKAGLNARVARAASGLQTRIAGAPPTPTPVRTQVPVPMKPASSF